NTDGRPGSTQLVTPETDGEPATNGSAIPHVSSAPMLATGAKPPTSGSSGGGTRRSSPDSGPQHQQQQNPAKREKLEKKASAELANFVVRAMNKYKAQMSHDDFKHEARKVTKILMEKERKAGAFDPHKLIDLSQHKKAKITQFIADYMTRLLARQP
ncbi:histone methyltransferase set2, partial [Coemansia erecta]